LAMQRVAKVVAVLQALD